MYIPTAFAELRPEVLQAFIRQHSFGTLVTSDPTTGISASHLPFLFNAPSTLIAHVARQNDQWRALRQDTDVLVIFQGPHAYVSPRWYEAKVAVPTWNYTAVHAYGRPKLIEDRAAVRRLLSDTVAAYEGTSEGAWRDANLPDEYLDKMAAAVVAFQIGLTRIEGKFKLNQNRTTADRTSVARALDSTGSDDARGVAQLMRETIDAVREP